MAAALHLPPGLPGSGRRRYAAAMWFHARGALGHQALEVFRVLAPRDGDDPAPLLQGEPLPPAPSATGAQAVEALRTDLVLLLGGLHGQGITETRAALNAAAGAPVTAERGNAVVARHLDDAASHITAAGYTLADTITAAAPHLPWQTYADYPEAEVGPDFANSHAFCSLLGEVDACWEATGIDVGLFLMAPGLFYRDHAHPAPELYLPLTGPHSWRFRPGAPLVPRAALAPVWTDPGTPHATLVGAMPFLCLYAWLAEPQTPAWIVPADDWARYET